MENIQEFSSSLFSSRMRKEGSSSTCIVQNFSIFFPVFYGIAPKFRDNAPIVDPDGYHTMKKAKVKEKKVKGSFFLFFFR